MRPEWVVGRNRLRRKPIQCGMADESLIERIQERGLVDHATPADVDDVRSGAAASKQIPPEKAFCFPCQRQHQDEHVAAAEKARQGSIAGEDLVRRSAIALRAAPSDDAGAKRYDSSRENRADLSETRDPDREVSDLANLEIKQLALFLLTAGGG